MTIRPLWKQLNRPLYGQIFPQFRMGIWQVLETNQWRHLSFLVLSQKRPVFSKEMNGRKASLLFSHQSTAIQRPFSSNPSINSLPTDNKWKYAIAILFTTIAGFALKSAFQKKNQEGYLTKKIQLCEEKPNLKSKMFAQHLFENLCFYSRAQVSPINPVRTCKLSSIFMRTSCHTPYSSILLKINKEIDLFYSKISRIKKEIEPNTHLYSQYRECLLNNSKEILASLAKTEQKDFNTTIKYFISPLLKISIDQIELKSLKISPNNGGMSKAQIIEVKDPIHQTRIIVKAFPEKSRKSFLEQFYALHSISSLNPQNFRVPKILKIGRFSSQGFSGYLLAMEYAPGDTISDSLLEMLKIKEGSEERSSALLNLEVQFRRLGKCLAEYAYSSSGKTSTFPLLLKSRMEYSLNESIKSLDLLDTFIKKDDLSLYFKQLWAKVETQSFQYGFMHGDINLGNFIYDSETDALWFVDLGAGSLSIYSGLKPIGSPFYDYAQFIEQLRIRKIFGLTEKEIIFLQSAFENGFLSKGGIIPNEDSLEFYTFFYYLELLKWYSNNRKNLSESQGEYIDKTITSIVERLSNQISHRIK